MRILLVIGVWQFTFYLLLSFITWDLFWVTSLGNLPIDARIGLLMLWMVYNLVTTPIIRELLDE